jgi:hypothetical protein
VVEPDEPDDDERKKAQHPHIGNLKKGGPLTPSGTTVLQTPGGTKHTEKTLSIAPEMRPFVMRNRPDLSSPRTSRGLSKEKVKVLRKLFDAHKQAK